jgi:hypothetical protein
MLTFDGRRLQVQQWITVQTDEAGRVEKAGADWLPKLAAGWHLCLDVAEQLMDGAPTTPIRGDEAMEHGWQELHDAYAERLGIAV